MSVINTNVQSLVSQQALSVNGRALSQAMQQLSTGKRINSAADDAAGLAISDKMTSQVRGLNMAVRNANDAISMIQTVEGATVEVTNMLQRMRELAVQAANGTNSSADRTSLNSEYSQLGSEITRISDNTTWNGFNVGNASTDYSFQVGASGSQTITVTFNDIEGGSSTTLSSVNTAINTGVTAVTAATNAIAAVDSALAAIDSYRADLGSKINRLQFAADNLSNISTNQAASRSRILDTDYAKATTDLAKSQIIQQAATAMLAQANQQPSSVLKLLQ